MIIIGADYRPGFQQIAFMDTDTGELQESRLQHVRKRKSFIAISRPRECRCVWGWKPVDRRWFERLLSELHFELWIGDAAEIRTKRVRKQKTDRQDGDRLVSELRLAQACDLDAANRVLTRFCADYNQRFAVPAREAQRDFRSLPPRFDLNRCLSFRYQRVVGPDHVITFGAHSIALPALPSKRGYAGDTVELSHHLDGLLLISYRKVLLLSLLSPLPLLEHADRRPCPAHLQAEIQTPDAPHLQPQRPTRFGRRYLIDKGDTVSINRKIKNKIRGPDDLELRIFVSQVGRIPHLFGRYCSLLTHR